MKKFLVVLVAVAAAAISSTPASAATRCAWHLKVTGGQTPGSTIVLHLTNPCYRGGGTITKTVQSAEADAGSSLVDQMPSGYWARETATLALEDEWQVWQVSEDFCIMHIVNGVLAPGCINVPGHWATLPYGVLPPTPIAPSLRLSGAGHVALSDVSVSPRH